MSLLESKARKKEKLTLRTISLSIFKEIFIIYSYFYISESFGSISTPFLTESTFSIQFSIALFLLTFFSFLAGPIHGFFSGFLGELLYQTAYYSAIHFEWCFIVGLIGLLAGTYKYKPLKYHHGMKVYYTFLMLLISSFLLMFFLPGLSGLRQRSPDPRGLNRVRAILEGFNTLAALIPTGPIVFTTNTWKAAMSIPPAAPIMEK